MNKNELLKQIQHYNLSSKLQTLAEKDKQRRPFRHLPKQFSKGILIGNIAIVPNLKIAISRNIEGRWRLIGWATIESFVEVPVVVVN